MKRLLDGYLRFRAGRWPDQRQLYRALHDRQTPDVCIVSCCDARVDPMSIFDAVPGDLFIVRNVANLVPPYEPGAGLHGTSTAIEFAVRTLKVETILVLGHARCGGVAAAMSGAPEGSIFLKEWVHLLDEARRRAGADPGALELKSIRVSLDRLKTFPFVAEAVGGGSLKLAGARFSIFDGRLEVLDPATGIFSTPEF